jgi:hypothetical protein
VDIGEAGTVVGLAAAAVSVVFTGFQIRRSRLATQSQFLFQIMAWYLDNRNLRDIFYRLDYHQWRFDPATFSGSDDEPAIDHMLFVFELVERLIRSGTLNPTELEIFSFEASRVLHNAEIQKYLDWLDDEYRSVGRPAPAFPLARALANRISPP